MRAAAAHFYQAYRSPSLAATYPTRWVRRDIVASGNAVKDFGSRIRKNSDVFVTHPKSCDFGYDNRADPPLRLSRLDNRGAGDRILVVAGDASHG